MLEKLAKLYSDKLPFLLDGTLGDDYLMDGGLGEPDDSPTMLGAATSSASMFKSLTPVRKSRGSDGDDQAPSHSPLASVSE